MERGEGMNKPYMILYRGQLADRKLTRRGAEARAYELAKEKGWEIKELEVREECQHG